MCYYEDLPTLEGLEVRKSGQMDKMAANPRSLNYAVNYSKIKPIFDLTKPWTREREGNKLFNILTSI